MATELGKAYVQIVPSAKGISGSIENVLNGEAGNAGTSIGNKLVGSLKKVIAAAGIGAAIKKSLDYGAELQQNLGGTEAVFGNYANNIQKKAKSAYMNMGLSASDYMATANKMGSLFQGSGLSQVRSLKLTQDAMQRAADVASVMGIDTTMAMESIAGAAKGNFTMMDNLGVAMNATTLEAYALEKGINFKWNTASNAEKAELAMKMFMDRTSQYAGNFARESEETLSGSLGAMKAAFQDFMGNLTLGQDVGPAMNNLVQTAVTYLKNLIPAIGNIFKNLPGAVGTAIKTLHPVLLEGLKTATAAVKKNLPGMLENALTGLMNFSGVIRKNAGQLVDAGLKLIKAIAEGIIKNIPTLIETAPTIISNFADIINDNAPKVIKTGLVILGKLAIGLIKAIPVLIKNIPKILKAIWKVFTAFQWINLGKAIMTLLKKGILGMGGALENAGEVIVRSLRMVFIKGWNAIKTATATIWNAIKTFLTNVWNGIKTVITTVMNAIKVVVSTVWSLIKAAITIELNAIKLVVTTVWNAIKTVITTVLNAIKTVTTTAWNAIKTAIQTVVNAIQTFISGKFNAIKSTITTVFNAIKSVAASAWNAIKTYIVSPIQSAYSTVASVINSLRSSISSAFNSIKSTASSVWNGIKSAIISPIQSAKETVMGIVNTIKGFFPLNLGKIFNLQLPHFRITSYGKFPWGVGGKGSTPKWTVDWYAHGGVFDNPNVIGVGEAGREIVTPENLMRQIVSESNERQTAILVGILNAVEYIAENDMTLEVSKREFGRMVREVQYG